MRTVRAAVRTLQAGQENQKLAERAYKAGYRHGQEEAEVRAALHEFGPDEETIRELGEWLRAPFNPEAALRARADRGPRARRK